MSEAPRPAPIDYALLAEALNALAYPLRLALLDELRFPHTLGEIRVSPLRLEPGGNPDRPAAKATVLGHLEKLMEAGIVGFEEVEQAGKQVRSYAVQPQRLYAITEELRRLSTMHAGRGLAFDSTGTMTPGAEGRDIEGPHLVLVHGVYEGKPFPLTAGTRTDGRWVIGRQRGLAVALDYDPFVSQENAAIHHENGRFHLTDMGSKNGTTLNWRNLPKAGAKSLRSGDLIGVGRSRLLFLER